MPIEPFEGEPDIQRLIDQIRGKPVDRVPHLEALIEDIHVTKILGREAGNTLAVGGDPAKGAEESTGRPMHANDLIEFNQKIGQDLMMVECFWTPFKTMNPEGKIVPLTDRSVKTREDWHKVIKPGKMDADKLTSYVKEYKDAAKGTKMGVTLAGACFFQTLYEFTVGLTDFMMMVYEQRDLVEEMVDISAEYFTELYKRGIEEGIDVVFVADDYAWKQGTFINPKLFKELWFPRMAKIIEPAVNKGIPVIFHSDGKIDDTVDWLLDIGVDAITPLDPYSLDYRDYKKRYGDRLCLFGNIDVEFPLVHGTPNDVDLDVKAHAEVLKPGGRWVAGSSHSTGNMVPHENFCAMINAFHKYGKY